jgi:hypothetical protein
MGFLDTLIPIIVFIVFGFILLSAFKKPLGAIWAWLSGLFAGAKEKAAERREQGIQSSYGGPREIVYE